MRRLAVLIAAAFVLCAFNPVQPIVQPLALGGKAVVAEDEAFLDSVIDSVVFELDATLEASYPGEGQVWKNVIANPADGVDQEDYDFWLGINDNESADDPTFVGGGADSYWLMDGGDAFRLKENNTQFTSDLPKTGTTDFWAAMVIYTPATQANTAFAGNGGCGVSGVSGLHLSMNTNNKLLINTRASSTNNCSTVTDASVPANEYTVIIYSLDKTNNVFRSFINTTTPEDISYTLAANSTNADRQFHIGATGTALAPEFATPMENGSRVVSFAMGNEFIDNTKAAAIIAHLEERHNRSYTE